MSEEQAELIYKGLQSRFDSSKAYPWDIPEVREAVDGTLKHVSRRLAGLTDELLPEELKPGMVVTVDHWIPYPNGVVDRSWIGDEIQITSVCLPLVYGDVIYRSPEYSGEHFDTRQVVFRKYERPRKPEIGEGYEECSREEAKEYTTRYPGQDWNEGWYPIKECAGYTMLEYCFRRRIQRDVTLVFLQVRAAIELWHRLNMSIHDIETLLGESDIEQDVMKSWERVDALLEKRGIDPCIFSKKETKFSISSVSIPVAEVNRVKRILEIPENEFREAYDNEIPPQRYIQDLLKQL